MSDSGSGTTIRSDTSSHRASFFAKLLKGFEKPEPTRVADLVVLPLALSTMAGLLAGLGVAAHDHYLDPLLLACTIGVYLTVQVLILLLVLAVASMAQWRIWSATLCAMGFFSFLVIPDLVIIVLHGVPHWLTWCIGAVAAFQLTLALHRHRHSRFAPWFIALPALISVIAFSYLPVREFSQLNRLPNPPNSPNVLIIIVDTLRADHLSPYGYSRETSPFINQLAQQGVVFDNAISPSSWTLPAHASILTGLYPHANGVGEDVDVLSGSLPTLGAAMRQRGYRTGAFSANFEFFCRRYGFLPGFSHFEDFEQSIGGVLEKTPITHTIFLTLSQITGGDQYAYLGIKNAPNAETINDNAFAWIMRGHRPFFAVLNYFDVHQPVLPPEPYLHMYTTNGDARKQSLYFEHDCEFETEVSCESERPVFVDTYDGAVRYVDQNIQNLLSQLNARGILQNTIVVFTSDHGQELGDHGLYGHGKSLFWGEIHVPLIIWKPGLVPASVHVQAPVTTIDLPATILDLTAPGSTHTMPGQSLATLWHSSQPVSDWPDSISELAKLHWFAKNAPNYNDPVSSIVTPQWQYIHQGNKELLFAWKTDPEEAHDLCASQPNDCAALRARLQAAVGKQQPAN